MTRMGRKTTTKFADDEIVVAWQSGSADLGGTAFDFRVGARFRGDHPVVRKLGRAAFVPDGTPSDEMPSVYDEAVKAGEATAAKKAPKEYRIDPDAKVRDLVVAQQGILMSKAGAVPEGYLTTKDDPIVVELPGVFVPLLDRLELAEKVEELDAGRTVSPPVSAVTTPGHNA